MVDVEKLTLEEAKELIMTLKAQLEQKDKEITVLWEKLEAADVEVMHELEEENKALKKQIEDLSPGKKESAGEDLPSLGKEMDGMAGGQAPEKAGLVEPREPPEPLEPLEPLERLESLEPLEPDVDELPELESGSELEDELPSLDEIPSTGPSIDEKEMAESAEAGQDDDKPPGEPFPSPVSHEEGLVPMVEELGDSPPEEGPAVAHVFKNPPSDPAEFVQVSFEVLVAITKKNTSGEEIGENLDAFREHLKKIVGFASCLFPMTSAARNLKKKSEPLSDNGVKDLLSNLMKWKGEIIDEINK